MKSRCPECGYVSEYRLLGQNFDHLCPICNKAELGAFVVETEAVFINGRMVERLKQED